MRSLSISAALAAAFLLVQIPASAQMGVAVNRDSLRNLSTIDHVQMMSQLGITSVRPGWDGYDQGGPNGGNYDEFKANPYPFYPEVLETFAGKKVETAEQWWKERRPELVRAFEDEVYGRVPDNVPAIRWKVVKEEKMMLEDIPCLYRELAGVADNSAYPAIEVNIQASVIWPESAGKNIPVVVEFGYALGVMNRQRPGAEPAKPWQQQVVERGWAAATITTGSIQADGGYNLRNGIIGLANKGQYRKPTDWGALRAWGWGASRLIDYFEGEPLFDATKVAIEGCSRNGKAALVAMAFDQRFAAGFIASSGKGGAAPWRRDCGEALENLTAVDEYHWMAGNFIKYGSDPYSPDDLPVDQHELIALCAPRLCLISAGVPEHDRWQDIYGMFIAASKASPVYELLGAKGLGTDVFPGIDYGLLDGQLAFREHHGDHEAGPNWPYFLDLFDRFVVNPAR